MSSDAVARMGADGKEEDRPGWHQQVGQGFDDWMESRVARYETRKYDWDVLKFQADFDPKYRRAQMRYMGTGGTGMGTDNNTVPSEHFTFSTMVLPPGCEGPPHLHTDVEEVFFMLRGSVRLTIQDGDKKWESVLKERDLISVPARCLPGTDQ